MESDGLGLHLALLDINFVADQDDGDVFANADQVTMPVGNVLVCDTRSDVEHDDTALSVDVVPVAKTTEFLLPCCVPDVELDLAIILEALGQLRTYTRNDRNEVRNFPIP